MVRHHEGCEKFVHSQRGDRRAVLEEYGVSSRDELPQGALNDMDMTANAQALINISRRRLCNCASVETREAWRQVIDELRKDDPVLAGKCVRECIYRGFCPEWMSSCRYSETLDYKLALARYRNTDYGPLEWKDLGVSGYEINQHGTIRDSDGNEVKLSYNQDSGYLYLPLPDGSSIEPHIEVAKQFLNWDGGNIIHRDGNRVNNHKDNLRVL